MNRLLRLKIYSYKFKEGCNDLITGLIINKELYELFPNIIKFKDFDTDKRATWEELTEKEKYDLGYSINTLIFYFILAFQQHHKEFIEKYEQQKNLNHQLLDENEKLNTGNKINILNNDINELKQDNEIMKNKLLSLNKSDSLKGMITTNEIGTLNNILDLENDSQNKMKILHAENEELKTKLNHIECRFMELAKNYDELYLRLNKLENFNMSQSVPVKPQQPFIKSSKTLKK